MLLQHPLKANETRVITTFDPRSAKVDTISFEARAYENTLIQDGTEKRLLHGRGHTQHRRQSRYSMNFSIKRGIPGKQPFPPKTLVVYTTTKETAIKLFRDVKIP